MAQEKKGSGGRPASLCPFHCPAGHMYALLGCMSRLCSLYVLPRRFCQHKTLLSPSEYKRDQQTNKYLVRHEQREQERSATMTPRELRSMNNAIEKVPDQPSVIIRRCAKVCLSLLARTVSFIAPICSC
jgi:hypothetical protein